MKVSVILGSSTEPGLFWRRRNAKLDARLNTVVETSERKKHTYKRKTPGVVIDTSFVDQQKASPVEDFETFDQLAGQEPVGETERYDELSEAEQELLDQPEPEAYDEGPAAQVLDTASAGGEIEIQDASEALELLEIAIERYELAERQEEEAKEREAQARREIEQQQTRFGELEKEIQRLRTSEQKVQEQRDLAVQLTEETWQRIIELEAEQRPQGNLGDVTSDDTQNEALLQTIDDLQLRSAELEADVEALNQALSAADDERDVALELAEKAEAELNRFRNLVDEDEQAKSEHAEALEQAKAEVAAASEQAQALTDETSELHQKIAQYEQSQADLEHQLSEEKEQRQAAKNERENWVKQHKDLESQVSEAHGLIDEQKNELVQLKAKLEQQEQNSNKKIEELQQANELLSSAKSEHDQASVHWKLSATTLSERSTSYT